MIAKKLVALTVLMGFLVGLAAAPAALAQDSYPQEWSSLDVAGLTALAEQYGGQGQAGLANLKLLAGFVTQKYATDSQAGTVDWNQWCKLVCPVGPHLAEAMRAAMVTDLKQELVPDQAAVAGLSLMDMRRAAAALYGLSHAKSVGPVALMWVTASDKYKACTAKELSQLCWYISPEGASGTDARVRLIGRISQAFLTDDATVRQVGCRNWLSFATCLGKDLSDAARAGWLAKLRSAFEAATLSAADSDSLALAIERLGGGAGDKAVAWMNSGDAWKALDPPALAELARRLVAADAAGEDCRVQLADHIHATYLSDAAAAKAVKCAIWSQFVKHLANDLAPETKAQWAQKLRSALASSGMNGDDVALLAGCLHNLGDGPVLVGSLVAQWMGGSQEWKTWEPARLAWLAQKLDGAADAGEAGCTQLTAEISGRYLTDSATTRSMGARNWKEIVGYLHMDFGDGTRSLWSSKLRAAYAPTTEALRALSVEDMRCFAAALAMLDQVQTAGLLLDWLESRQDLSGVSGGLAPVAAAAAAKDKQEVAELLAKLEPTWLADHGAGRLSWEDCGWISAAWKQADDLAKAQSWANKAYQSALGSEDAQAAADKATLAAVCGLLIDVDLVGQGKAYPAYATVLARLAGQGALDGDDWETCHRWSLPLGSVEACQLVQAQLLDALAQPRAAVARILSWGYRQADQLNTWQGYLDGRIGALGGGDPKAGWLLARAYAESMTAPRRSPLAGKAWLDSALNTARSASVRVPALEEMTRGYAVAHEYEQGGEFLNAAAARFPDALTQEAIASLRAKLTGLHIQYLKKQIRTRRRFAEKMDALAAATQEDKDRQFFLKWAERDRRKERELLARLAQIEQ